MKTFCFNQSCCHNCGRILRRKNIRSVNGCSLAGLSKKHSISWEEPSGEKTVFQLGFIFPNCFWDLTGKIFRDFTEIFRYICKDSFARFQRYFCLLFTFKIFFCLWTFSDLGRKISRAWADFFRQMGNLCVQKNFVTGKMLFRETSFYNCFQNALEKRKKLNFWKKLD